MYRRGFTTDLLQEISEMLAGRMSNQDEDEVEDELEALEAEVSGVNVKLPDAPSHDLEEQQSARTESAKERAQRRAREQEEEEEPQMIPA